MKTIALLLEQRKKARENKDWQKADEIRKKIEQLGYKVIDKESDSSVTVKKDSEKFKSVKSLKTGLVAVFGSGEMSPTGRRIHEYLIKDKKAPVKIALLETPAGFEENPRCWYGKLADMLRVGLAPYQLEIAFIEALRNTGSKSTNNRELLSPLLAADYIHTGAGSPTYCVKHLKNSLAFKYLCQQNQKGLNLSFASAAAIAMGKFVLPVYEIYKAGAELRWQKGLDFFGNWGLNLTIIPHWNNSEGGKEIDTCRCFMGEKRFAKLLEIIPGQTYILGIDEQTAAVFDSNKKKVRVLGNGNVTVIKGKETKIFPAGSEFSFAVVY